MPFVDRRKFLKLVGAGAAVSSVPVILTSNAADKAVKKKPEDFKLATIFTFRANEDDSSDMLDVDVFAGEGTAGNKNSRDFLEDCIKDYNKLYGTNYSTEKFYDDYRNLQKRVKDKQVDFVLVVNMFLTGCDSSRLNTLYVDKPALSRLDSGVLSNQSAP